MSLTLQSWKLQSCSRLTTEMSSEQQRHLLHHELWLESSKTVERGARWKMVWTGSDIQWSTSSAVTWLVVPLIIAISPKKSSVLNLPAAWVTNYDTADKCQSGNPWRACMAPQLQDHHNSVDWAVVKLDKGGKLRMRMTNWCLSDNWLAQVRGASFSWWQYLYLLVSWFYRGR